MSGSIDPTKQTQTRKFYRLDKLTRYLYNYATKIVFKAIIKKEDRHLYTSSEVKYRGEDNSLIILSSVVVVI